MARLEAAAACLGELVAEVVFLGGATVELWISDPAAPDFRPTADVDVVVEIGTRVEFHRFEKKLRSKRFEHDQESGVICRFIHPDAPDLLLDAMPTDASILGFENRWQAEAFPHATPVRLPGGQSIDAVPPPYLLATKLEAFKTRGKGDFYGSRDFEDVIALVDGREELVAEVEAAPPALRRYVAEEFTRLVDEPLFESGVEGALGHMEASERAALVVRPRIDSMIAAAPEGEPPGDAEPLR